MTILQKYIIARIIEDQEMLDKLQGKILECYDPVTGKLYYVEKKSDTKTILSN